MIRSFSGHFPNPKAQSSNGKLNCAPYSCLLHTVLRIYLLITAGKGEKKVYEARADTFLIQLVSLLWKASVQLQMGTEDLREENIQ